MAPRPRMPAAALAAVVAVLAAAPASAPAATCAPRTSPYSATITGTSGLAGYWRLGEAGGSTACDSAGADHGTYQSSPALGVPGAISADPDTAVRLDGSSQSVSVPSSATVSVGDSFTVEAWVRRGLIGGSENQVIASKQDGAWVLMFNPSNQIVLRRSTVADVAASNVTVTDTSKWHHVAVTKTGSSVHIYLDGVDVTAWVANQTMADNTQPLAIGQSTGVAFFNGTIDEVALYRGALSATQIRSHFTAAAPPPPPSPSDPVIAAAGDIACDTTDPSYNGGVGTVTSCRQKQVSDLLVGGAFAGILALGDNQYDNGTLSQFQQVFAPSWGRVRSLIHPVAGNHEYNASSSASGYFDYFDGVGSSTGAAGARGRGYYSFDIGTWHLVALNSNCWAVGGCGPGSAQESWLRSDLAAHPAKCTLAYWHHPRFTSGSEGGGDNTLMATLWQDLYAAGADLALAGHDHDYERFTPLDATGGADASRGMREFVVGTGGKSHHVWGAVHAGSQARNNTTFGILKLTLHPTGYDWRFAPEAGATYADAGSGACH